MMEKHSTRKPERKANRGGRPAIDPNEKRSQRITFRVTRAEADELRQRATTVHLELSEYLRAASLERRVRPPTIPAINLRAIGELNRIGNNLNQLVKLLHQGQANPPGLAQTVETLRRNTSELKALLAGEGWTEG